MSRKGIPRAAQEEIVKGIQSFALYGFPESHAASFALIAYASAYLKAYYPAAFACALLNNQPMGFYHPATIIQDAARHGVATLPVDATRSQWACSLEESLPASHGNARHEVRLGLKYVRGLRRSTAEALVAARPFASLADLCRRGDLSTGERATLAEIGAFGNLGGSRRQAMWQVAALGRSGELFDRVDDVSTVDEFSTLEAYAEAAPCPLPEMNVGEEVVADFHFTGVSTGPHPMSFVRNVLATKGIVPADQLARVPSGHRTRIAGLVIVRQRPATAKGLLFVTLEDETGFTNALVSSADFEQHRQLLICARALVIEGTVQNHDGVVSVRAERFFPLQGKETSVEISHDFC